MHLEVDNVWFSYPNGTDALAGVDLEVPAGSVHAIVGPSGCGKSTLLRILCGLAEPTRGAVHLRGPQHHTQATAMVFETPRLLNWWTVDRNVGMSAEYRGVKEPLYRKTVNYVTSRLGLREMGGRRPDQISSGEQTRVAFGRAFVHDADIMLLDEPFASLDSISRRKLWSELETHWQLEPRTYLIVTHDVEEAIILGDKVSVMAGPPGRILDTLTVDLPRPRTQSMIVDPGYRSVYERIWELLLSASP